MITIHGAMLATDADFYGAAGYLALCAVAGLEPTAEGYGFLLALDDDGRPYTAVTWDVDYVRLLLAAVEAGQARDIEVPAGKILGHIREWPWMWVGAAAPRSPAGE